MEAHGSQLKSDSSSHRLPTVSASQVLERLKSITRPIVSSGLPELDLLLRGPKSNTLPGSEGTGLSRGKVTELYGPPGVGKTAFGLQVAANVLQQHEHVVWLDCGAPLEKSRLSRLLKKDHGSPGDLENAGSSSQNVATRFEYTCCTTLAHILAKILHPRPGFPRDKTGLVVLDSLSTAIDTAYHHPRDVRDPQYQLMTAGTTPQKSEAVRWMSSRKYTILGQLSSALSKIALINNLAVLVTSQTMTRVRPGQGAILLPAIGGAEWSTNISTHLVLFRDFPPPTINIRYTNNMEIGDESVAESDGHPRKASMEDWLRLRYIGIIKLNNRLSNAEGTFDTVVPFTIDSVTARLRQLDMPTEGTVIPIPSSPSKSRKRRRIDDDGRVGVRDSDDDDEYGWAVEDELAAEGLIEE